MRFLAIFCALLGAVSAAPVSPPSIASSDTTLVDHGHHHPTPMRMVTLEFRNLRFWINPLGRFQLSEVHLKVPGLAAASATCRADTRDTSKILCDNPAFKVLGTNFPGLRRVRVQATFQSPRRLWRARQSLSLSRDVQRVEIGGKQVLLDFPN